MLKDVEKTCIFTQKWLDHPEKTQKNLRGEGVAAPPPPSYVRKHVLYSYSFSVRTDAYCNVVSKLITMPYLINKVCLAISKTNFYGHREKIVSRDLVD